MKTLVCGMSGWWSGVFPWLQKPIILPFQKIEKVPGIYTLRGTWHANEKQAEYVKANHHKFDKVIFIGHSYGSSGATHAMADIHPIPVRLFISLDQGADSWVIKDRPIRNNVSEVDEWLVAFERLTYEPGWPGKLNYKKREGGHTEFFIRPETVQEIADRIIAVHNE